MIGIITGREIKKNKDGDADKLLLQVELVEGDVQTVEMMPQSGEDTNPATGSRIFVLDDSESYQIGIASTDDLTPEVDPGEKEIYSTDEPATEKKARIRLYENGNIIIDAYGGANVEIRQDGVTVFNGGVNNTAREGDTVSLQMDPPDIVALATALLATGAFVPAGPPPGPAGPVSFTNGFITSGTDQVKMP